MHCIQRVSSQIWLFLVVFGRTPQQSNGEEKQMKTPSLNKQNAAVLCKSLKRIKSGGAVLV